MRWLSGIVGGGVVAASLGFVSPALAAFPGRNGLLAVQPVSGPGILVVAPNGSGERRICTVAARCGAPSRPRWSPDGRALVFAGPQIKIVYPDGSCLDCQLGRAANPAFLPSGTLLSFLLGGRVTVDGIDGIGKPSAMVGRATDAVWSANGKLAVVRKGVIWAGRPGGLRRIGVGSEPSWSPDGDLIVAVQRGWVVIMRLRGRGVRRIARGSGPAFSPDGRWIAFIGADHRLMIIPSEGRDPVPRPVGRIRAISVDWQPKPRGPIPGCAVPPGSTVIASTPAAVVTGDVGSIPPPVDSAYEASTAYMGCLRANGRERLLDQFDSNNYDNAYSVSQAVLAAPYAALVEHYVDDHYGGQSSTVQVFDLRTGTQDGKLGGETASCPLFYGSPCGELDHLVLGSDGVSAAHVWQVDPVGFLSTPLQGVACAPAAPLCVAADGSVPMRLFTSSDPSSGAQSWGSGALPPPALADMGDVACPSQGLCVAASNDIFTSTNPSAGASTWTRTSIPGGGANSVACPSTGLCVVSLSDGSVATSTNPAGGASAWSDVRIDPNNSLLGVFCSAAPQCFITDSSGRVFTSTNPSAGAEAWTMSGSTPRFFSGSCPTANLCVSVGYQQIATSTDPGAGTWTTQSAGYLNGVSCPSASLCLAVGFAGTLEISTDPAAGTWSSETIDHGRTLTWIDCPSASLCVATDQTGHVVTSTDPTGGPSAWTPVLLDGDPCTDTTPCSVEQIQASDRTGLHTVDTSKLEGSGPFLTGLTLTGDTLSWSHDGTPRQATLTP